MNLKSQIHRISRFPYRHEGRSQEIFLALRAFLFPSQKVSPFPLSHIRRYTPYRHFERSEKSSLHSVVSCSFRRKVFPFSAVTHRAIYTIPSFRAQREIFLALHFFLLPSQMDSPFPLSHIRRYTSMQERSLDFARDDDTGIALSKHIRCSLREINPFPHTVMRGAARNIPCTLLFLAPFAKGFPFSAVSHTTLSPPARKIPRLRSG